jgi:hypothetical protein
LLVSDDPISPELVKAVARAEYRFSSAFGKRPGDYILIFAVSGAPLRNLPKRFGDLPTFYWREKSLSMLAEAIDSNDADSNPVSPTQERISELNLRVLPHELGHFWLETVLGAGSTKQASVRYGSQAPDWFDEASAFLTEEEYYYQLSKKIILKGYYSGSKYYKKNFIINIDNMLAQDHPLAKLDFSNKKTPSGTLINKTVISEFPESKVFLIESIQINEDVKFTDKVRFFSEYLLERAGGKPIFGSLRDFYLIEQKFEVWLKRNGAQFNLPTDMTELQNDWQNWFTIRHGI